MAFRALLFSKKPETNTAMTMACENAGIRVEVLSDIFNAIEQAKTRVFSCVIVDWADQPEATFLLKRARESASNPETVSIAVVDHEPTAAEMRDNRLDFLIYRPIADGEAAAVLTKASEKMPPLSAEEAAILPAKDSASNEGASNEGASHENDYEKEAQSSASAGDSESQYRPVVEKEQAVFAEEDAGDIDGGSYASAEESVDEPEGRRRSIGLRAAFAAVLVLAVALGVWRSHDVMGYLAQLPSGRLRNLRDSIANLLPPSGGKSQVISVPSDEQQDVDSSRDPGTNGQTTGLGVVAATSTLDLNFPLPKAADLPLPVPVFERPVVVPIRVQRADIPESMRNSPTIAPPIVVTTTPAQMMPISAPQSQPLPSMQQTGEPVAVSEETERALLIHGANPIYPPEALPQKLHGAVVLQAVIGRDGNVEDLKIVRGYFVLGRAASAAVKQWQFQPYILNGRPASAQTMITINFSYPPK